MPSIETSLFELERLDRLSGQSSPVHRLDPRVKLLTVLVFLVCVVSFGRHEVAAQLPFLFFPLGLAGLARLPPGLLVRHALYAAPFVLLLALSEPLLDPTPALRLGSWEVSGGWLACCSILLRGGLTVTAVLVLLATTGYGRVIGALRSLGAPAALTTQLLLTYRYLFVLGEEAVRLVRARALRSFGRRGLGWRTFGALVGHLLLRSLARAGRVHRAMQCRGFAGTLPEAAPPRLRAADLLFGVTCSGACVALRLVNGPQLLGDLLLGWWR